MSDKNSFFLDGEEIPFTPGQTVIQAAKAAGSSSTACATPSRRSRVTPMARASRSSAMAACSPRSTAT